MKKSLFIAAFLVLAASCGQKPGNVAGKVESQLWAPVAGVNVSVVKGSATARTDFEGKYTIHANEGDTLLFELPGYRSARAVVKDGVADATLNLTCKTVSVAPDGRITFTYPAPDAKSVQVCGNFFQLENGTFGEGIAEMKRGSDGLWTYTTVPTKIII